MPTRRQLIQKNTLNASASSVTFSNIPQNYTDLILIISARTDRVNNGDSMYIRFNGDTAANYTNRSLYGTGGSVVSIVITSPVGIALTQGACGNSDTANTFGSSAAYISNYTSSTSKSVTHRGNSETNAATSYMSTDAGIWTGTAAITSMSLVPGNGTNFLANSTFYLYGITQVPIIRGGAVTVPGDGFKYHTFRSSGSLQVIEPGDVEFIAIGGGGGGGGNGTLSPPSGGGGAGGRFFAGKARASQGIFSVVVGSGGAFDNAGTSSSIISLTSSGGNFGLRGGQSAGGVAFDSNSGSGGTSGLGTSIAPTVGGNGTNQYANILNAISAGQSGRAAAGGGGGGWDLNGANGGLGGGGKGGNSIPGSTGFNGENGVINTGSGGGGSGAGSTGTPFGGSGGSGIVIIRYPYDGN